MSSSSAVSSLSLPLPLILDLWCVLMWLEGSLLLGLYFVTLLCLLSWRPLRGLLPLVFTSSYLCDVQLSFSGSFGLCPVVAAGAVV